MGLFGGGSEARKKAKMYGKLEKKLGEKLNDANMYYSDGETGLNQVHTSLADGPGEAEGRIFTDFISKEGVWNGEYRKILMAMQNAKIILATRKAEAASLKAYWEMQAELEEARGVSENG
ncbi:MAG: hypothetical protein K2M20_06270 [Lachnospiraceae bacterium]|nr:hypothetical protein [Lachnospiraceae bacterium]